MTERHSGDGEERSDAEVDSALTDALRTRPMDPRALARMREAVAHEWRASVATEHRPLRSRRWLWTSLAAAVAISTLTLGWFAWPVTAPVSFGSIARSETGDVEVRSALVLHHALHAGDVLRTGDKFTAQGPTLVALSSGGTLRIAGNSVVEITSATEIRLERGMIYVDKPPALGGSGRLRVLTQAGLLEHLGTAFEVLSEGQKVRVRVREGRIRMHTGSSDVVADAGTELLATPDREVSQHPIPTYGGDWLWVAALTPDYDIEGQALLGYLQWVTRELGQRLEFADAHAREVAERTILHGTVRGRAPLDSLANVLATTTLAYELRGDTIWIQSPP
ncbi:MAG: hypothetical protein JWN85_797 [Gammaproteobacteria bacterium]|nr:hypothetical protein [Gammaproteobacteria bacterium]